MIIYNSPFVSEHSKDAVIARIQDLNVELSENLPSDEEIMADQTAWTSIVQNIKQTIETEVKLRQGILEKEKADYLEKLEQEKLSKTEVIQNKITTLQNDLKKYEAELSNLGMFSFSKKSNLKKSIETTTVLVDTAKTELSDMLADFEQKISSQNEDFEKRIEEVQNEVDKENPIPVSPLQKNTVKKYIKEKWPLILEDPDNHKSAQIELRCYILIVLEELACPSTISPITELINHILSYAPYCNFPNLISKLVQGDIISPQKVSAETRALLNEGIVERTEINDKGYFSIK